MKRKMFRLRISFCLTLLAITFLSMSNIASAANTPSSPMQLLLLTLADNAMTQTHRLLNESSAAKRVIASKNAVVKTLHKEAMTLYEQAARADASGDEETRDQILNEAKTKLFKAAQLAEKVPGLNDHSHSLYQRRVQSATALLDAHRRIRKELKPGTETEALENQATTDITAANARFKNDDVDGATRLIDQALSTLKGSLISMRNGTTLVRTLHFDRPEEEYEYELGRNQSYTLLTGILLQKKNLSGDIKQRFDKDMSQAKKLRRQAEAQAAKGEYEAAIQTLEESTRHIVRATRATETHIPD